MNNKLKVQQSILKAVRDISTASFDERLGDYHISFSLSSDIISIQLWLGDKIEDSFKFQDLMLSSFTKYTPAKIGEIDQFESDIESAINEIFEYVESNKYEREARLDHITENQFNANN